VGDTWKPQIREEAAELGLGVASKPDSHDICFIPDGRTQAFLGTRIGMRPGIVKSVEGETLAEHDGVYGFTIGQRKGLGLPGPAADGQPRYVTDIDATTGTVTVGRKRDLRTGHITADRLKRLDPAKHGRHFDCEVQVRAHGGVVPATATLTGAASDGPEAAVELELHEPLQGVARGQAAVIYLPDEAGDILIGSGTISATAPWQDAGTGAEARTA
jgi:tRNA-specific 2-thiouridylase